MKIISLGVNSAFATGTYEETLNAAKLQDFLKTVEHKPDAEFRNDIQEYINSQKEISYRPKWQANFLIEFDRPSKRDGKPPYRLIVDFGGDVRHSLKGFGLNFNQIDGYYVSHPHADHIGGVEGIALMTFFNPAYSQKKLEWLNGEFIADKIVGKAQEGQGRYKVPDFAKPDLFGHRDVLQELWQAARPGLRTIQGVREIYLDTYFDVHIMIPNRSYIMEDGLKKWSIYTMLSVHIVAGDDIMPSYGLILESDKMILMPTDTQFMTPPQLKTHYKRADIVYQDCETSPFPSGVHPHINELKKLPQEYRSKMLLYHYDEPPVVEEGEFLGTLKTWEIRVY
ncbi:MAG TPA: MBL fold metallo-hydrolase [Leptospiraceae bacterium]|nr:MBL fold metallo-hydrolase [Leptospiraceae bacterium]HNF25248.1 MBL fold metallo-hydrolase [Leptospiraceae bacterium]HNI96954.1 MBL fold metallo-hydrolase [Leptospiraceae bacterium]HNM05866.1 MBL fold metallo-hydrolase [Leptospiraceae bacterium]HNN06226.1 MBL fold metallo-hydrolase [Leptospiraceae bacterium]